LSVTSDFGAKPCFFRSLRINWGIFEYYGRRAEELEARRKPPP
jgi:hypothetical protein